MTKDKQIARMRDCLEKIVEGRRNTEESDTMDNDTVYWLRRCKDYISKASEVLSSLPAPQTESEDQKAREIFLNDEQVSTFFVLNDGYITTAKNIHATTRPYELCKGTYSKWREALAHEKVQTNSEVNKKDDNEGS